MRSRIVLSLAAVSAIVALGASPALAAKKKEPAAAAGAPAPAAKGEKTRSAAQLANDQKMKDCGSKWRGMNAAQKAKYDGLGKAKKDKNGKPESGWIVYSVECRKA